MPNKSYADAAQIAAAQYGFQTLFNSVHDQVEDPVRQLAMEIPSTSDTEEYDWFGDVPGLQEWLDDRPLGTLRADRMRIPNFPWASGIAVNKYDILDDKLGKIRPRISTLSQKAAITPGYLLGLLCLKGHAGIAAAITEIRDEVCDGLAYDGLSLFNAAHFHDTNANYTFSNVGTAALAADSYNAARAVMQQYKDDSGKMSIGVNSDTLLVGPTLERTALEVVQATWRAVTNGPVDNVLKGTANVIVTQAFTGSYAAYWCLADLSKPLKPLIFQVRQAPEFSAADQNPNDDVFMRNRLKYGVDARWGLGYGAPCMIWGSDGTT